MSVPTADVVVLGGGPYGLATAAHLRERGVATRVFGDPMSNWRDRMPTGMFLKSTPSASNISTPSSGYTLYDYCKAAGITPLVGYHPVPIETFSAYGCWFQEQVVPQLERARVVGLDRGAGGSGFSVTLDTGEQLSARAVVLASGFGEYAYVPPELAAVEPDGPTPTGLVSHSSQFPDLSVLAGKKIAVIGAGQSALETAALAHEHGADVQMIVRSSRVLWGDRPDNIDHQGRGTLRNPESPLGPGWPMVIVANGAMLYRRLKDEKRLRLIREVLGPAGAWWLRDRVENVVPIRLSAPVSGASRSDGGVTLAVAGPTGPATVEVEHVVAATGYLPQLTSLGFLKPALREQIAVIGSWPRLSSTFESSVSGLYFTGYAAGASFGPLMRFVCGTPFAARRVSAAIAKRRS